LITDVDDERQHCELRLSQSLLQETTCVGRLEGHATDGNERDTVIPLQRWSK